MALVFVENYPLRGLKEHCEVDSDVICQTQLGVATSKQVGLGKASLSEVHTWNRLGRKVVLQTLDKVRLRRQLDVLFCTVRPMQLSRLLVLQPNMASIFLSW